jgi:glycosyltransferase involved in cell wall biosynthesis
MITYSGIGVYIRSLLPYLKQSEFQWRAIVQPDDLQFEPALQDFSPIVLPHKPYSILEQVYLPLKVPACDIFWSPHFNIPLLPIRAKKRVVTIHDVFYLRDLTQPFLKKAYANFVIAQAVGKSDRVIAVSSFTQSEISECLSVSKDHIIVLHQGLNHERFKLGKRERKEQILFVGNLMPHKNLIRLLEAFKIVRRQFPGLYLKIAGDIKQEVPETEHVDILGKVSDEEVVHLYQESMMTVYPSLYEGFGFPPLEAMCCGCPAIVSQIASLPEVCGDAALYVNPLDPQNIADAIERLLVDKELYQELQRRGLERARLYSWGKNAMGLLNIFRAIG